jgi:hypothetical protein
MRSLRVQRGASIMTWTKQTLTLVFMCALGLASGQWEYAYAAVQSPMPSATQPAPEPPKQLQHLVAPLALYPDELVAQSLLSPLPHESWAWRDHDLRGPGLGYNEGLQPRDFARGFGEPNGGMVIHSGVFNGFDHGGAVRRIAFRGGSRFGGGFHGGTRGFHDGEEGFLGDHRGFHDGEEGFLGDDRGFLGGEGGHR